jgi:hypothetical protein
MAVRDSLMSQRDSVMSERDSRAPSPEERMPKPTHHLRPAEKTDTRYPKPLIVVGPQLPCVVLETLHGTNDEVGAEIDLATVEIDCGRYDSLSRRRS